MKLVFLHIRISVLHELQYRANFVLQLFRSVVSLATGLVVLRLLLTHTSTIGGWNASELQLVLGFFLTISGLIGFGIAPAMSVLVSGIQQGTLDHVLLLPVDSQLGSFVREFRLWKLTDVAVGLAVVIWSTQDSGMDVGVEQWGFAIVMLGAGLFSLYSLWLLLSSMAFWITRVEMLTELFAGFQRAGQYPVSLYPGWLRGILLYIVPIGLAISAPAESIADKASSTSVSTALLFAALIGGSSRLTWMRGLRRYTGASA